MKPFLFRLLFFSLFIAPSFLNGQIHIEDSPVVKNDSSLYAIAVTKNHKLVYEYYFNQKSPKDLFNDQSLTKGIISILVGIAINTPWPYALRFPLAYNLQKRGYLK
jgi:hypothetical protein